MDETTDTTDTQIKATDWSDLPSLYAKRRQRAIEEQGLTPISDHLPPATRSPPNSDSTPTTSFPTSSGTGAPSPAPRLSSSTGTSLSKTDSAMSLADAHQALEAALQQGDPDQVERLLYRSLKPYSRSLKPTVNDSFDLIGYERVGTLGDTTAKALQEMAEKITKPAGRPVVARAAGRCLQVTKARETDSMDLRLMVEIFCDELAEFPEDVVQTAFRKWARREKWWPSLSEIRWECQKANRWRESFAKAVRG